MSSLLESIKNENIKNAEYEEIILEDLDIILDEEDILVAINSNEEELKNLNEPHLLLISELLQFILGIYGAVNVKDLKLLTINRSVRGTIFEKLIGKSVSDLLLILFILIDNSSNEDYSITKIIQYLNNELKETFNVIISTPIIEWIEEEIEE